MVKPVKILQASAGSGKTFSLTIQYLSLLFSGNNKYKEILAVTFTDKATSEMKDRILTVLRGLAKGDNSKEIESYREILLRQVSTLTAENIQARADILYRTILHDYSRFAISTIDSFVQKVVRSFAFELGLSSDYSLEIKTDKVQQVLLQRLEGVMEEKPEIFKWVLQLVVEKIDQDSRWDYNSELNNLLSELFKDNFDRFDHALQQLDGTDVAALFTQLKSDIEQAIKGFEKKIEDYKIQIEGIINDYGAVSDVFVQKSRNPLFKLNSLTNFSIKDIEAFINKFHELTQKEEDKWFQKKAIIPGFYAATLPVLQAMTAFFSDNFSTYVFQKAVSANFYYLRLMQELSQLLADYRQETGSILIRDAQNLINGITTPLDENGQEITDENPSFIWEKIGNRFQHFLIDEFQDTSHKQWKNFKALISNAIASSSHQQTEQLLVGDTKQSIYRWRNSDLNILHSQAAHDLGIHNIEHDQLKENHRSSSRIIEFNNRLYAGIAENLQSALNGTLDPELSEWWQANYGDFIPAVYQGVSQETTPRTPNGGIIKVVPTGLSNTNEESEESAVPSADDDITAKVINEIKWLSSAEMGYQLNDIAILTRSNSEASEIVNALLEASIPVISGDALSLASNNVVKLLIETLKVMVIPDKENALHKAQCIAYYHRMQGKEVPAEAYFSLAEQTLSEMETYLPKGLCTNWQDWKQLPLAELIEKLYQTYELIDTPKYLPYLLAFRDLIALPNSQAEKGIKAFLAWWDEEGIETNLPASDRANAVQVMTVFKSKGLAFRAVLVPFCKWTTTAKTNSYWWINTEQTEFESLKSIPLRINQYLAKAPTPIQKQYFKEQLDCALDALNILYVATTRAKEYLFLGLEASKSSFKGIGDSIASTILGFDENTYSDEEDETEPFTGYEVLEPVEVVPPNKDVPEIELSFYPYHERISSLFEPKDERQNHALLQTQAAARQGILKHQLLANAHNETELQNCIEQLKMEGTLQDEEAQTLFSELKEILAHPELNAILQQASSSFFEKSIVTAEGKIERPDRIIFNDDEVIVLDYKFTQNKENKHVNQVREYKNLLEEMGYSKVKAYLFYGFSKELILV